MAVLLAAVMLLPGCGRKKPRIPVPPPVTAGPQVGLASWYGHPYHGRRTASGELYDMNQLTAAHRTLAFGTWVRVRNLDNGKTVDVRINDRGPFVRDRIIDLSRAAAEAIGMIGTGTARVRLQVIASPASSSPKDLSPGNRFVVQVGAFRSRRNAERLRNLMRRRYGAARLIRRDGAPPLWRVLVGKPAPRTQAAGLAERIRGEYGPAFVVRLDGAGG